jgi:hypothetical protein
MKTLTVVSTPAPMVTVARSIDEVVTHCVLLEPLEGGKMRAIAFGGLETCQSWGKRQMPEVLLIADAEDEDVALDAALSAVARSQVH